MLRIHETVLELIKDVAPIAQASGRHDADLARQLRRALSSVPLNVSDPPLLKPRERRTMSTRARAFLAGRGAVAFPTLREGRRFSCLSRSILCHRGQSEKGKGHPNGDR